jgi:DNA processing protein
MIKKKVFKMGQLLLDSIAAFDTMKKPPSSLYYKGNLDLLKRPKISIVGTRRPSNYTKQFTYNIARALAKRGVCIVSGAAMGVDAVAHAGAGEENTIAVAANGLDIRYPSVNRALIERIENQGLVLSQFNNGFKATAWSFVVRNELVVALGDMLIVTQADLESGSMRSVQYAQKMGKKIFVLPQRLEESSCTNFLLLEQKATPIYDIERFASLFGEVPSSASLKKDDFFYFCQTSPTLDEALAQFKEKVYEAELEGSITIHNGIVRLQ